MRIEAENSKLKPIFRILYDNITEGMIQVTEEQLVIESATPDTTMMFSIEADSEFFDTFKPEIEEHDSYQKDDMEGLLIGAYLDSIYPILKKFSTSDDIAITLDETELIIASGDDVISINTLDLDPSEQIVEVEGIGLKSEFSVDAERFVDSVNKLSYFDQQPVMTVVDDDSLLFEIDADIGSGSSKMDLIEWNDVQADSMFGIRLLDNLTTAIKRLTSKDDELELRLGDERPLELVLDQENLKLRMFLAPRVTD